MNEIGYSFQDIGLLHHALTHSSYQNEKNSEGNSNERLEFVGDAVLGLVAAQFLYETYPQEPEGKLSKIRAAVVCEKTLAKLARAMDLGSKLKLGYGEEKTGGRNRDSILSDAFEAVIAAIYLDSDLITVRDWILERLKPEILLAQKDSSVKDYKTTLQERVQQLGREPVEYHVVEVTGPDHNLNFKVEILWREQVLAQGTGKSKKQAEQNAARTVLEEKKLETL